MLFIREIANAISTTVSESEVVELMISRDPELSHAQCREIIATVRIELASRIQRLLDATGTDHDEHGGASTDYR